MVERIKKIIEKEDGNPSAFADHIGISRSSMNHILNGRNNPSLDVLTKILSNYEDINTDWLLFGKPPMYKGEKAFLQTSLFDDVPVKASQEPEQKEYRKENDLTPPVITPKNRDPEVIIPINNRLKNIDKIMIFYSDHTFDSFTPDK